MAYCSVPSDLNSMVEQEVTKKSKQEKKIVIFTRFKIVILIYAKTSHHKRQMEFLMKLIFTILVLSFSLSAFANQTAIEDGITISVSSDLSDQNNNPMKELAFEINQDANSFFQNGEITALLQNEVNKLTEKNANLSMEEAILELLDNLK